LAQAFGSSVFGFCPTVVHRWASLAMTRLVAVLVALAAADTGSTYASEGSTTESPAQREWRELKKQEADQLYYANQSLTELQKWLSDIEAQEKDKSQSGYVTEKIEEEAEEEVKSNRSSLESQFESSLQKLSRLSESVSGSRDPESLKEEAKKDAEDAMLAAKKLEHLEKEKCKNMMKTYHELRSKAKAKASDLKKEVMHRASHSFDFARKAESAGRKAGQKESQYEGDEEHAEMVTEHLSGQGEHAGEKAEDKVEGFFEKIEEEIEHRRDTVEHQAERTSKDRKSQVKEAKEKFEAALKAASQPTSNSSAPVLEAVQLRGSEASFGGAGFAAPGFVLGIGLSLVYYAWVRPARLVSTPQSALG